MHHSGELEALRGCIVRHSTCVDRERELIGVLLSQRDDAPIDIEIVREDILT